MSNFRTVDQELLPATINGCRWGGKPRLLARTQDHLLVWIPGYTSYVNRMVGNRYSSASMVLLERREHAAHGCTEICEGRKLHRKIFKVFATEIDAVLGEGFHALLEPDKTVIVGDNEPFSYTGCEIPITPQTFGYEKHMAQKALREKLVAEGVTGVELEMRVQQES